MTSEAVMRPVDGINAAVDTSVNRSNLNKKNLGKVPKRIHKAEREKVKRDELNKLFSALAEALELTEPNNGKASVLCEATRYLKDVCGQIKNLKEENASLLLESQFVTVEKNDLIDENSALETQIGELQSKLEEKLAYCKPDLNKPPTELYQPDVSQDDNLAPALGTALPHGPPVYVLPLQSEHHAYPMQETALLSSQAAPHVSKPHARYPTSVDLWPFEVLGKKPQTRKELPLSRTELDLNICSNRE